jgi:hypothetical protein
MPILTRSMKKANLPRSVKVNPYVQEHIDLVTCISQNIPINEAEGTAISNMVAIMGRVSAYTGKDSNLGRDDELRHEARSFIPTSWATLA